MNFHIICDSSVNHQKNLSVGSYMILDINQNNAVNNINKSKNKSKSNDDISDEIKSKFTKYVSHVNLDSKSSTDAELELVLYILIKLEIEYQDLIDKITLYTDCSNLFSIESRTIKENHSNIHIYKKIIYYIKKYNIEIIKIKGHKSVKNCTTVYDHLFRIVDKDARKTLRELVKETDK